MLDFSPNNYHKWKKSAVYSNKFYILAKNNISSDLQFLSFVTGAKATNRFNLSFQNS
jgi:hypothetical protein